MLKQTAFRLSDATVAQLDEIARRLPKRPGGMPATRTDAVVLAAEELFRRFEADRPAVIPPRP